MKAVILTGGLNPNPPGNPPSAQAHDRDRRPISVTHQVSYTADLITRLSFFDMAFRDDRMLFAMAIEIARKSPHSFDWLIDDGAHINLSHPLLLLVALPKLRVRSASAVSTSGPSSCSPPRIRDIDDNGRGYSWHPRVSRSDHRDKE